MAPQRSVALVLVLVLGSLLAGGCASDAPTQRGEVRGAPTAAAELAQSDANRMATLAMQENLEGLLRLAEKLYRRNPAEWRKGSAASREQALEQLHAAILPQRQPWPALQGRRDIAAMALALAPEFAGDRVAAFIYATADMVITAHGGKTEFFLLDGVEPSTSTTPRAMSKPPCGCLRSAAMRKAKPCCWPTRWARRAAT
jgi:hypothetical protein